MAQCPLTLLGSCRVKVPVSTGTLTKWPSHHTVLCIQVSGGKIPIQSWHRASIFWVVCLQFLWAVALTRVPPWEPAIRKFTFSFTACWQQDAWHVIFYEQNSQFHFLFFCQLLTWGYTVSPWYCVYLCQLSELLSETSPSTRTDAPPFMVSSNPKKHTQSWKYPKLKMQGVGRLPSGPMSWSEMPRIIIPLAQGNIKAQNLKYSFYWTSITFAPPLSKKLRIQTIISQGPWVHEW
jgi:hypothetical protein